MLLVVLQYFIAFDPSKDQFDDRKEPLDGSRNNDTYIPNPIDEVATWPSRKIKEILRRRGNSEGLLHKYLVERPAWQAGFEKVPRMHLPHHAHLLTLEPRLYSPWLTSKPSPALASFSVATAT